MRQRAVYVASVNAGREYCRRCGRHIPPGGNGPCPALRRGRPCGKNHRGWDMGHDDFDRTQWTGPEHVCCNRATRGRHKRLTQTVQGVLRQHREW